MWAVVVVVVVVVYCVLSWFLLRYPRFLWRPVKPHISFPTTHIAHRGGGGEAVENTLSAFRKAWSSGIVDVLELDVRLTRDKVCIVAHDPDFSRILADPSLPPIEACDYAQLPLLHGQPVCRLEDLLDDAICQGAPISLDFKCGDVSLIRLVHGMFSSRQRLHLLVWGSFDEKTRQLCQKLYPDVPTFFSLYSTALLYLSFLVGLLPFVPLTSPLLCSVLIREEWLRAFASSHHNSGLLAFVSRVLHWLGPSFFAWLVEHPLFVQHLQARGVRVAFWTVNDEHDMKRVRRSNASGIITDFPSKKLHTK